jgi:hypothetical protein
MLRKGTILLYLVCSVGAFLSPPSSCSVDRRASVSKFQWGDEWSETTALLEMKNKNNSDEETERKLSDVFDTLKKSPGTLIALPFLIIFGLDLLLNIAVITKRSLEYILLGQAPNSDPWW